jgi:phosphoglycerol transferase MdoB-like AlkP superfamily enzyme
LVFMTLTRIVFLLSNLQNFPNYTLTDFLSGIWFDIITVSIYFIPYYALMLFPLPIQGYKVHQLGMKILFHIINMLFLALNLIDVEYFKYTSKRSTFDIFAIVGAGNDVAQLTTTFIRDFWWLILVFILCIVLSEYLYRKTIYTFETFKTATRKSYLKNSVIFILAIPIFIILGRGGFGLRPVGIIEASRFTSVANTALVLNTPFTIMKSYGKKNLDQKNYFSMEEEMALFNPIHVSQPQNILPDGTNVMIIILESFGNEFVGSFNEGISYTPFLDSLIDESLTFEYAFANGKKSIEAVPAIIASIPSLMDNPYISSSYGNNKINSLADILKNKGYSTAFFHGASNGSMRFDAFAKQAGFEHYFGRTEYNNDDHFDQTWGILDEYFNPWTARQITQLKEPFFSTLFTLSSHHPYFIPKHMLDKVKQGPHPICASINYGDYALKKFFEEAEKQPWFDNTLFVICADHTPASNSVYYSQRTQMYRIPILFYHPKKTIPVKREKKIFQQLDILPTVLDFINIKEKYYSFGTSYFQKSNREAITYLEGNYFYYFNNHMLTFSNERARNLLDFVVREEYPADSLSFYREKSDSVEKRLKAIIQRYNRDLIRNQTAVE